MRWILGLFVTAVAAIPVTAADQSPAEAIATGLKNPYAVVVGADGKVFVSALGEVGKDGDGAVFLIEKNKAVPFATGLDDPRGLAVFQNSIFVADKKRIWRIDQRGKARVFVAEKAFPAPPALLCGLTADPESGNLFVSDSRDQKGSGGAIFRISPRGRVELVTDSKRWPALHTPTGLVLDGQSHLLVTDAGTGELHRVKLADRTTERLADGLGEAEGLAWDWFGRLYIRDAKAGRVSVIGRPGQKPVTLDATFAGAGGLCLDPTGRRLLVPEMPTGQLRTVPTGVPGAPVDETPMPLRSEVAFPNLKWSDWQSENAAGAVTPLRPLVLTHAGDGSNRVFVATEHGVIHVFPNDQKATKTQLFLDLQDRVKYNDNENEEGFLGLTFSPDYQKNGEFFVFYTSKKGKRTNVLSRFHVSRDDPNRADPASEEEILRIVRPFWNHDGGTVCFGPDGYLYVALGDGGLANDPFGNGQNLKTLLGKVLRLDVNHKDAGMAYAIPKDNPFAGAKDVRPEIWAYGLRNVWRMAFDRQTGVLWAGDVGQNLYEEINLLKAGGNYGWNLREALHPFGSKGIGPRPELIDPIWEYHHDVGKSITGGLVYRGSRFPDLQGSYVYGDYVSNKIWALRYSVPDKRVVANRPIRDRGVPIMSFGEDEQGEIYHMTYSSAGQGIFRFAPGDKSGR